MKARRFVWAIVTLVAPALCRADLYFNDGLAHTLDHVVNETVLVDDSPSGAPTTLNLVQGGRLSFGLLVCGSSSANVAGGRVEYGIFARDSSTVLMTNGGTSPQMHAYDHSTISVNGEYSGGGQLIAFGYGHVDLIEGSVTYLQAADHGSANMSGGWVVDVIAAGDYGQVTVSGARQALDLDKVLAASVNPLPGEPTACVTLYGSDFYVSGSYFGYGELAGAGQLSGLLADGMQIISPFEVNGAGRMILAPEPTPQPVPEPVPVPGAALLGALGLSFAGWRLRRRRAL